MNEGQFFIVLSHKKNTLARLIAKRNALVPNDSNQTILRYYIRRKVLAGFTLQPSMGFRTLIFSLNSIVHPLKFALFFYS